MKIKTDGKVKMTRDILFVYAISGAVLFNLLQYTLYGIYWLLPGSEGGEGNLRGAVYIIGLLLSVPGGLICDGLGLQHVNSRFALEFFRLLINGVVGAFLFTAGTFICKFIRNGYLEVKP